MSASQRVLEAIAAGHRAQQAEHAAKESLRLGTMSGGGSVGAILSNGSYVGKCARLAILRMRGVSETHGQDSLEMFSAGYANEDVVVALLKAGGLAVAHDIGLEYNLPDGRKVSSHLDLTLQDAEGKIHTVIETKLCASIWTAKGVHFDLEPKSDHLIQLGHYLMQCPDALGVLLYSSRSDWHLSTAPRWLQAKFPPGTYDVEFKADGTPMKIRPFTRGYDVWWQDNELRYMTPGLEKSVRTKLTKASIQAFYAAVSGNERDGVLPPRPSPKHVNGNKSYLACDYCPLKATCDVHEAAAFQTWFDHAQLAFVGGTDGAGS